MDRVYTIAAVPKPLDKERGSIQAAPTYGIRHSRKRKRHEIAVAVDGEGVNIYNVRSQALSTSYPLPPQTYLDCAPCSVVVKDQQSGTTRRQTYIITRDGYQNKRCKVVQFSEPVKYGATSLGDASPQTKLEAKLNGSRVQTVQAFPNANGNGMKIVVLYDDGNVETLSKDLGQRRCYYSALDSGKIEYAMAVDLAGARKGLLKSGLGIMGNMSADEAEGELGLALCRITNDEGRSTLSLFSIPSGHLDADATDSSSLPFIMSCVMPREHRSRGQDAEYDLHVASGLLYKLHGGRLSIFDLTSLTPKIVAKFGFKENPILDFSRLNASSVLAVSATEATVFELSFGTATMSYSLQGSVIPRPDDKTRRSKETGDQRSLRFITNFSELGQIVALSGADLLSLPSTSRKSLTSGVSSTHTFLSDVVGQVHLKPGAHLGRFDRKSGEGAPSWTQSLQEMISRRDTLALEVFIAKDFNIDLEDRKNEQLIPPLVHPDCIDARHIERRKALELLGMLFRPGRVTPGGNDSERISLLIPSASLLVWLALAGYLSARHIQSAWLQYDVREPVLEPGDIVSAIQDADQSFQLLHEILISPAHLEVPEVVGALKLLVQSLEASSTEEAPKVLSAPPASSGDVAMVNGHNETVKQEAAVVDSASHRAEVELQRALTALSSGLELRSQALRLIFSRLCSFSPAAVTSTMRKMLTPGEIIFLIHILRIELADGGWTSRYVDTGADVLNEAKRMPGALPGDNDADSPLDQAIRTISSLLNCAIDAVGMSGWLVGLSNDGLGSQNVIESLRAEISAGLEGCYEAENLGNQLKELEKYAFQKEMTDNATGKRKWRETGTDPIDPILPLGCRVEVPKHFQKGKRTKLDAARERNRMVGQYEFDRIRM